MPYRQFKYSYLQSLFGTNIQSCFGLFAGNECAPCKARGRDFQSTLLGWLNQQVLLPPHVWSKLEYIMQMLPLHDPSHQLGDDTLWIAHHHTGFGIIMLLDIHHRYYVDDNTASWTHKEQHNDAMLIHWQQWTWSAVILPDIFGD